jgi:ubiquinone/menaquinone biosynthesis C-methylase UbiE
MINLSGILQYNRSKLVEDTYAGWFDKKGDILDVGCGDGILTYHLSKSFKRTIIGCDIDNFLVKPVKFKIMTDKNTLPYPNKSFDIVMFNDVLHHTEYNNQVKLLKEAIRISKKYIIIMENLPCLSTYIFDFLLNKIYHPKMDVPFTFRNKNKWLNLFSDLKINSEYKLIKKPITSPFPRIAFRLTIK